jgi:hypothetical protein
MGTLTDAEIRALKPAAKNYRKAAGRSLYLEVTKDGRKIWRVRFRSGEKDTAKTIGEYPRMTLKQAREVCESMMNANSANVAKGRSFEVVAREFLRMQSPRAARLTRLNSCGGLSVTSSPKSESFRSLA